jgi:hypothetical protein
VAFEDEAVRSFERPNFDYPVTRHHIEEKWNPRQETTSVDKAVVT